MVAQYDPTDLAQLRNPHAVFAEIRSEEPVSWCEKLNSWIVTGYEDATDVLTDPEVFSGDRFTPFRKRLPEKERATADEVLKWFNHWMVFKDPPHHTRLRRHMAAVLNDKVFNTQSDNVQSVVNDLADKLPRGEAFDYYDKFALWMPGIIVADLLGVERDKLLEVKQWSDDMMTFIGSARGVTDKYQRAARGATAMGTYFLDLIEKRQSERKSDVLSLLMDTEVEGEKLGNDELVGCMMMVLNGGHETTANLLNNSLLALSQHPDVVAELKQDPSKMPAAVEELLRYDSPVLSIGRVVMEETELGDKTLAEGDRIFAMLVGANRDPEIFDDPNTLQIDRAFNPHMAFGKGPHFCLGTPLARMEAVMALNAVLERFSTIELAEPVENIPWTNSLVTRGPAVMPLILR